MLAIILAGGLGTRLRDTIGELPKPLAPVRGRPFLEYLLDYWIGQGISRFVLSVGYRHESISRQLGTRYRNREVIYAVEPTPLGTGGGVMLAARAITGHGPSLVLNGDTYFAVPLREMRRFHEERRSAITLALFTAPRGSRYGRVGLDENDRVLSFGSGSATREYPANGGVYLIEDLQQLATRWGHPGPLSLEQDVLVQELKSGSPLFGFQSKASFIDIGVPEDYVRADSVLPR